MKGRKEWKIKNSFSTNYCVYKLKGGFMDKVNREKIKRIFIKINLLLVILMCSPYIFTGLYLGKEITGSIKRYHRNLCNK